MTVLIVEDNAGVRRLLRRAIGAVASAIWECEDGAEALVNYATHRPDVVLMDIRMGRVDGLSATRQIRQFDSNARIVIVTGYEDDEVRRAAHEAGSCGYVLKANLLGLADVISLAAAEESRP